MTLTRMGRGRTWAQFFKREIEGGYLGYTLKWESNPIPHIVMRAPSVFIPDESIAFICNDDDLLVVAISNGAFATYVDYVEPTSPEQFGHNSIYSKYYAIVEDDLEHVRIFKDGVLLQTINLEAVNDLFDGVAVSWSGKYIIVTYSDDSEPIETRYTLKCYEGS